MVWHSTFQYFFWMLMWFKGHVGLHVTFVVNGVFVFCCGNCWFEIFCVCHGLAWFLDVSEAIVDASMSPMAILVVGVGDGTYFCVWVWAVMYGRMEMKSMNSGSDYPFIPGASGKLTWDFTATGPWDVMEEFDSRLPNRVFDNVRSVCVCVCVCVCVWKRERERNRVCMWILLFPQMISPLTSSLCVICVSCNSPGHILLLLLRRLVFSV